MSRRAGVGSAPHKGILKFTLSDAGLYTPGQNFAIGDILALNGGTFETQALVEVTTLLFYTQTITNGGALYTVGNILTTPGTEQDGNFTVTGVDGGGAVTGLSINALPVTTAALTNPYAAAGGTGGGCTISYSDVSAANVTITEAGLYTVVPTNPVSTTAQTGAGTSFQVVATWIPAP